MVQPDLLCVKLVLALKAEPFTISAPSAPNKEVWWNHNMDGRYGDFVTPLSGAAL